MPLQFILFFVLQVFLWLLISTSPLPAQTFNTLFEALYAMEEPEFKLTTDLESLLEKPSEDFKAKLEYTDHAGNLKTWDIKVEPRGKYRLRSCTFPPLELNFKKGDLRESGYADYDKFKLVTHCLEPPEGKTNVYEEYLVYKLYNILTEKSYRVILLEMVYQYHDSNKKEKGPAILIEPTKELTWRLQGTEVEQYNLPEDSLVAHDYNIAALFQFMIGNSDWDLMMQRNVKMVRQADSKKACIVPYDFDFSAIVMPSYAVISPDFGVKDFRDRIYLGKFFTGNIQNAIAHFLSREEEILQFCMDYKHLSRFDRKEITHYLEKFFTLLRNAPEQIEYGFILPYEPKE